ncbi:DUF4352 domain-containing protein [Paraclostridium bifermentans]|uniref:hypothetical protein n=1 Tax=Paraclostridium bifermentans TaxID=1490 RepID=UPI00387AA382
MIKKRIKSIFIMSILILGLTGCAKEVKQGSVESNNDTKKEESTNNNTAKVVKENGMVKTPVFTNKNLNLSGEVGGVKYNYKEVQISDVKLETDEAASTFDVKKGDEVVAIVFNVEIENTTDKDVSFYTDQAKLITNTKQQVDTSMILSDDVGGDLLGKVKKEGNIVYILKNDKAKDLKTLELRIDAPIDAKTFESLGDSIELNLKVN